MLASDIHRQLVHNRLEGLVSFKLRKTKDNDADFFRDSNNLQLTSQKVDGWLVSGIKMADYYHDDDDYEDDFDDHYIYELIEHGYVSDDHW